MVTKCPHCNAKFKARDDWKGRETKCPKCEQTFIIHEFGGEPASSAGVKGVGKEEPQICANCDREIGRLEQTYVYEDNIICLECYNRLKKQAEESSAVSFRGYAGFWRRFVAAFIDGIIVNIGTFIIGFVLGFALVAATGTVEGIEPLANLVGIVIVWLYYAVMESSSKQATIGKMALGIVVADVSGNRVSFGRATGRHFAKFVSFLTLFIGFIMAGFTEKKQALHDMIAGCLVIRKQ